MLKGFKVFNPDWTCRGFKYEVGKTYEEKVIPSLCAKGFHFCKNAKDCFNYYSFNPNNKVAEVIAHGEIDEGDDKCCTNKLEIVREIPWHELLTIVNIGKANRGLCNTGNQNTGDWNTGNRNTGDRNTGDCNTGDWNTGDWNTGNCNTGDWNTGDWNTGGWNTGDQNTGDWNTGDWNTGDRNTGDRNTGNCNTGNLNQGDFCTGDMNISDHETGCFCTEEHTIRIFDVESDMTFRQWRDSDAYSLLARIELKPNQFIRSSDMTDEEKVAHPEHETMGGYLKVCDTGKAFSTWWDSLTKNEKSIIKNIPNFNAEKFLQLTGIQVND